MEAKNRGQGVKTATAEAIGRVNILAEMLRVREETLETSARLEAAIEKVGKISAPDCLAPAAMAGKCETIGETKSKLNTVSTMLLGILAGVFIGLGAMLNTVVTTNSGLGFGMAKLVGGLAFCLGLILVVVAGAELFTGNTLIVMSWMSGKTRTSQLLRNWGLVYAGNLIGSLSLVALMFYTNQWSLSSYGVGANALAIANAKVNLTFGAALARGILCNALVCLAVWLCFGARTTMDKIAAIIFPITAFVAAGFEHSIANMYFIPIGILMAGQSAVLEAAKVTAAAVSHLTWAGFAGNLVPVTIGNIIGGSLLIGAVYWVSYLRTDRAKEAVAARPWAKAFFPSLRTVKVQETEPEPFTLASPVRVQIEDLIRTRLEGPRLDRSSKALIEVLGRAKDDSQFLNKLAENPTDALKSFDLTAEEKIALSSGDINWIESKLGTVGEPLRGWLTARMAQEKW
ncbi:MAG: formate/nitrite family transporter [Dehalococcoidales bacterium]|nr:formate/nitrite family transporter [Dehalococcoidales bacterium]